VVGSVVVGSVAVTVGSVEVVGFVVFVGSLVVEPVSVAPPVSVSVSVVVPESAGHAVRVPSPVARARSFKVLLFMDE
jgi:hypothetical protein